MTGKFGGISLALNILLIIILAVPGCRDDRRIPQWPAASSAGNSPQPSVPAVAPAPEIFMVPTVPVPDEYRQMYLNLQTALGQYDSSLSSMDKGQKYPVAFGGELLTANCNRGPELLKPQVIKSVGLYLDRLKELGLQAITFPIHYPIMTSDYREASDYLAFYKQVMIEVRKRGKGVDIESQVIFANTAYSPVQINFGGITFDRYKAGRKGLIQTILKELQPDYLNIGAEPDTEAKLTGYKTELGNAGGYASYINYLLDGLDRGRTKIVAGIGTWGDPSWVTGLAYRSSLDGISIHIYPVVGNTLTATTRILDLAAQNHKLVVLDEAWLFKTDTMSVTDMAANSEIFKKDNYSFWQPIDQQFLAIITRLARTRNIEYISPFWTGFFFAYLDYSQDISGLSYRDTVASQNRIQGDNLVQDKFSPTGKYYQKVIQENR
jgi:hypothetical protein